MSLGPVEILGWTATAVFVGSYFCGRADALVRAQILGAVLWIAYGVLMRAPPVVVANVLVMAAAAWKARRHAKPEENGTAAAGS